MPSLLRRLNRLKPGGAFLFTKVMEPCTQRTRRHFATAWEVKLFTHTREQQVATSFSGWLTIGDAPGQVPPNWKQSMIVGREGYVREQATPYLKLHHLYITHGATACNGEQTGEE